MVVIGAGLAGSTLAAVLSRLGWDVVLLERRHLPAHKVCGEFLSPESQASLLAMGLYDTVAALSPAPMEHAQLTTPAGVGLQVALPGRAWGVSRFALDAALAQGAAQAGADVRMGVAATAVQAAADGYTVAVRGGEQPHTIRARAAVVASGRHVLPGLRTTAEQAHKSAAQTGVGVKAHYHGVEPLPQVELFLFRGGYVGLSPLENGHVNVCLLASRDAFARGGASIDAMLDAVQHWNPALGRRLAGGAVVPASKVAVAPVDTHKPSVPWAGVARLGDAATMIPPLCGDGMAMALRAAELCAPLAHAFLSGRCSLAAWEADYCQGWHREFDSTLRTGRRLQAALALPGVADALLLAGKLLPSGAAHVVKATRGRLRPLDTVGSIVADKHPSTAPPHSFS
jgi:flavin-dependent dehydrogenase